MRWKLRPSNAWGWAGLIAALAAFAALGYPAPSASVVLGLAGTIFFWFSAMESAADAEEDRERITELQRRNAALEALHQPRTIEPARRSAMVELLRENVPDGALHLQWLAGTDTKPAVFARVLKAILEEAGWRVHPFDSGFMLGVPPSGLAIRLGPGEIPPRAAVLREALCLAGLEVSVGQPEPQPGTVKLFVGLNPQVPSERNA